MLEFILFIFFVQTDGAGYIPTQDVKLTDMSCGLLGQVVGTQIDREVNPTKVMFVNPIDINTHCEVSIKSRIDKLEYGEYHIALTVHDDGFWKNYPDPHTSVLFKVVKQSSTKPEKPKGVKVIKP